MLHVVSILGKSYDSRGKIELQRIHCMMSHVVFNTGKSFGSRRKRDCRECIV